MRRPFRPSVRCRRRAYGTALLAALVAGCGTDAPAPAEPVALTADVVETRAARSQAKVSAALANAGTAPVEVERLRLRSAAFEEVPATERAVTVPPGGRSGRFFLPYGPPVCDQDTSAVLLVTVRTPDGARDVEVPVTDTEPGLGRLHQLACAAEEVTEQARLGFGERWQRVEQDGEQLLRTTLRLDRRGTQEVAVTRLDGNVVFSLAAAASSSPLLVLPEGQASAELPVEVRASRCDPHALTESKRELLLSFASFARVADGPEAAVQLRVPPAGEAAVLQLMQAVCIAPLASASPGP